MRAATAAGGRARCLRCTAANGGRVVLLEWSLWVSERIGWPVVGTAGAGLVAVTWIAVACKRARKQRLQGAGYLRRTVRMNRALWWWACWRRWRWG